MENLNVVAISGLAAGVTQTSSAYPAKWFDRASLIATVADATTPVATAKFQASNDIPAPGVPDDQFTPTNWADIPSATAAIAANGSVASSAVVLSYRYIRVVYAFTSGTGGTVTVRLLAQRRD